jgi:ankyrin repeat protein
MTAVEPSNRPTAEDLVTQVLTAQNGEVRYGRSCCFEDFDSETTSWEGSVVEDEIFETAQTASNVTTWSSGSMPTPQPLAEEQIPQKELSHLLLSDPKTTPPATLGATYCASSIPSAISSGLEESQMSSKSNMLNPGAGEISISNPTKREKPETIERPRIEQYEPHHLQVAPSPDEPRTTNILVSSKDDAEIQAAKNVEYIPKNHQRLESYLLSLKGRDPNWRSQLSVLIEQGTCDSKGYNILSVACKFNNTALAQDILETVVDKNPELINKLNRYKNSALHYAASKGRTKMVETLIQNGAMPSIRNCLNQTALHIALKLRKENTVKLLCQHLSSDQMNAGDDNGWTLLHVACCYNAPIEIIHQLLAAGAEPNLQDYWGFTPFQRSNDTDVRKLLQSHILRECPEFEEPSPIPSYREWIKRFKEQDIPDCKCSICAMITILYNSLDSIEEKHDCCLCLTHLRIFARDALLASINGCEDALRLCECVRCVSGREYNAKNRPCPISTSYDGERESLRAPPPFTDPPKLLSGETFANKPLPPYPGHEYYDRLVKEEISRSAPNLSQQEMMAVALKSLADAGFKGTRRSYRTNPESAMKWVICNLQHLAHANTIVEILLNCGADVDTLGPPELKASLLYVASRNQDLAMMELLLEKKAGVDFPTTWKYKDCITPLRGAIRLGKTLSARTLLRAGANVDDQYSGDKSSLLHEAILRYDVAGGHIPLLLGHGASTELRDRDKNTPLHVAVTQKNLYAAMALLDGGADVEAIGKGGESPLSMALNTGNYEMVSKLLEYGANVYINCGIATSALFKAVKRSYVDIVRLLLEEYSAGEDIRRINKMGHSVLHLLTEASIYDEAVINAIMGYGSSVDAEGIGGWTPLHFAAYHGNIVMVKKLLEHGATIHLQNHDGHTPLDYAQSKRHPRIVECLGGTFKKSWWRRL